MQILRNQKPELPGIFDDIWTNASDSPLITRRSCCESNLETPDMPPKVAKVANVANVETVDLTSGLHMALSPIVKRRLRGKGRHQPGRENAEGCEGCERMPLTREAKELRNAERRGKRKSETTKRTKRRDKEHRTKYETPKRKSRSKADFLEIQELTSKLEKAGSVDAGKQALQDKLAQELAQSQSAHARSQRATLKTAEALATFTAQKCEMERELRERIIEKDRDIEILAEANFISKNRNAELSARLIETQGTKIKDRHGIFF